MLADRVSVTETVSVNIVVDTAKLVVVEVKTVVVVMGPQSAMR